MKTFYIPVYSDVSSPLSVGPAAPIPLVCPPKLKLRPVNHKEALLSGPLRRGAMCGWQRVIEIASNALLWGISAVIMRQATNSSEFAFAVMLQMKFCKINWTHRRLTWKEILTFLMVSYLHWTLFWARFTNILKVQIGSLRSTLSLFAGIFNLLAVSSLNILYSLSPQYKSGDRGSTVVKVLCYKSEGRWFDSIWCHWNFPLT